MTSISDEQISNALSKVFDPCSVAAGDAMSIVELGLVKGWSVADHVLTVQLCLTSPGCQMISAISDAISRAVREADQDLSVRVRIDPTVVWDPSAIRRRPRVPAAVT